jgi:cation transport protein ChaC
MLRREDFTEERLEQLAVLVARLTGSKMSSRAEREASLAACLQVAPGGGDVWVFGYGSLMWNPALKLAESQPALIRGYHRWFCLEMQLGRGMPDRPGLMLGLDRGGSCQGLAHRIAGEDVQTELTILWRREMLSGAYRPIWITAQSPCGMIPVLTFVVNRRHERYAGKLPIADVVARIAGAEGHIGTNRQYLYKTVEHLDQLGICDGPMHALARQVRIVAGRE